MNIRDRQILQIALPSIVSNITVPLLGMIDVAIVGHMGSPVYIGAVAVGSMIFNLVYWLFGFLRMGSSGMTSQALGRRDFREVTRILVRSMVIALGIALLLIVLQIPMKWLMFWLISPTPDVVPFATTYYYMVIWGAPAMMGLYGLLGWYIGMQNTRIPMFISIMQNVVNILASLRLRKYLVWQGTFVREAMGRFFHVNRDIFLRTLCLVAVNLYFTSAGARSGAVILSVNTVMMQLYLFFSYFMDGFAYAGEALGGRTYGAHNRAAFRETLRHLAFWAVGVTLLYTLVYLLGGRWIVSLLTDEPQVILTADDYLFWAWLVPAAGAAAFIWDGIFIGITATRGMLVSSFVSSLVFFAVYLLTGSALGNHGLWLAMIIYLASRGVLQTLWFFNRCG